MAIFYYGPAINDGCWHFKLRTYRNKIILSSPEGFKTRRACLSAIAEVKKLAKNKERFSRCVGADGMYYFKLVSIDGKNIGVSSGFKNIRSRNRSLSSCRNFVQVAELLALDLFY